MIPVEEIADRVARADERRATAGIPALASAYRLVHGEWDDLPDLFVERLAEFALVKYRDPAWADDAAVHAVVDGLRRAGVRGATFVFDAPEKVRTSATTDRDAELDALMDTIDFQTPRGEIVGTEFGRSFALSTRSGFSCGLFFDMRQCRHDLSRRWQGRRVLNLFAYTCGFGVVLAGQNDVTNVDTSAAALEWGRRNYALNGLEAPSSAFVRKDAFEYLAVAGKVGNRFDAIVLDPPSYSAGKAGKARRFSIASDLGELVGLALDALTPGGELLVAANAESLAARAFASTVKAAASVRGLSVVRRWNPAPDFPVPADRYHLKTALVG